ncbi:AarF/ABC1/UbiB kinase family protein [Vibrio parahaemolyticus]|uniref:ABC1 kinase family protein n=1 Tax=Vibrio parahaemolyticus TaxID=670 RepID=UPI00215CB441|nr:AarF/ABC1/UbiB kinase family protein [Vibrio parahaemolyticus]EHK9124420.1 AarF/ABC1/UbiB kinase family protein [Vibrio parahaemolyticus]EHU4886798.1 AarF/ABC1/UbiB kinase family protein [Vibrio parahaemolyticus]EHU5132195.1 AarF/ABC1/UbiB kinase family protein [Vibrio parahaemolyticus]MCR9507909.1 AarF/ABC1/UbiB kinase family protein [Vibrio parahaemolyticus]MCS0120541.1 AarF/ABC1/UbiB kinase family protein [Vibrio parahaemolyticus]
MSGKERNLPTHRISRFSKFASLATRVAGNVIAEGTKQIAKGNRPKAKDLLLTPQNIARLTDQLAHLRGAAMKLGQMLSMDAGDILEPELAEILARLRSNADPMPSKQLNGVMESSLGTSWKAEFLSFNFKPIASASIGQVHQAYSDAGDNLAVKVQYPGIRKSIDSDVDNVGTLLKVVGLIPESVDYKGLLEEAKKQLHDEADYTREAQFAIRYHDALKEHPHFVVPKIHTESCSDSVLAMEFIDGVPIEHIEHYDQSTRDFVMHSLLELLFRELFEFKMVQTDPNFANYLYIESTRQIGLLDFGATREYSERFSAGYRQAFASVMNNDEQCLNDALEQIGFFSQTILPDQRQAILDLVKMACEPMLVDEPYDFKASGLAQKLREAGTILSMEQDYWHTPPADAIFLHRKIGGMYLLAARIGAKVNIRRLVQPYLKIKSG